MKILRLLLLFAIAGCATIPGAPPHGKMGATSTDIQWLRSSDIPAITGNNATIVLFSMTNGRTVVSGVGTTVNRIMTSLRCDQPITLLYQTNRVSGGGSTWRTLNGWSSSDPTGCSGASPGRGLGDTVAAATDTTCDYLVMGPNSRLEAVTGATGPSACEVDVGVFVDRPPGI